MNQYGGRILMVVENAFPQDWRVSQEALELMEHGYRISVICLVRNNQKKRGKWNGISIYRIRKLEWLEWEVKKHGSNLDVLKGAVSYLIKYFYFTLVSFLASMLVLFKEGFDVIHVHNPPDSYFTWAWLYKLIGKKFVYDQHDLAPEMYLAKYGRNEDFLYSCLSMVEKLSTIVADRIICTNNSYMDIQLRRNQVPFDKVYVVRNGPNPKRVKYYPHSLGLRTLNGVQLAYAGMINAQDGLDYLLRSLRLLVFEIGRRDFFCHIFGTGDACHGMQEYAKALKIDKWLKFMGLIDSDLLFRYLSMVDICLSPEPWNRYNNSSTFVKILEYMAIGKPIVAFDLKETRFSARDAALYASPNDELEFAKAIQRLMDDPELRVKMGSIGRKRIEEELAWQHVSKNLIRAYENLVF